MKSISCVPIGSEEKSFLSLFLSLPMDMKLIYAVKAWGKDSKIYSLKKHMPQKYFMFLTWESLLIVSIIIFNAYAFEINFTLARWLRRKVFPSSSSLHCTWNLFQMPSTTLCKQPLKYTVSKSTCPKNI